jgi:hypothetical protein
MFTCPLESSISWTPTRDWDAATDCHDVLVGLRVGVALVSYQDALRNEREREGFVLGALSDTT